MKFPRKEYSVPFFDEVQYKRKLCPRCGSHFWTQNLDLETCGEATPEGCAFYSFINDPPTKRGYSLTEMRKTFLSFFERLNHSLIKPYPVVARWRDDIYLTHASIIDFQPYVTEGISPPPANPLVIVQPCIRMVDIANTGPTFGRHLTTFEMGGHHAFNYADEEIYWKDQTVRYHHDFVTKELGIDSAEIIYKEDVWIGGGNAGPDLECIVRGLELDTLVFMQFKVVGNEFIKLPIRTVDTGYGIDRYAWISQGAVSCFHAVYGELLDRILTIAGTTISNEDLLTKAATASGLVGLDKTVSRLKARRHMAEVIGLNHEELDEFLRPIESVFNITDHTKCLSFLLSEGVVPSNIQEGYLARLIFRRLYRLMRALGITAKLHEIIDMQIRLWSKDYPHLKEMQSEIAEIVSVEERKFKDTIKRGAGLVARIAQDLRSKKTSEIPVKTLIDLYDSHGLPPEIVKEFSQEEKMNVRIPEDFYALIAERHLESTHRAEETKPEEDLKSTVSDIPETKQLYYDDQYLKEFESQVLRVLDDTVVLEETCFYPEGGGQPADTGHLVFAEGKSEVIDVQKIGNVIVHKIRGAVPKENSMVRGHVDWERRYSFMKNHTATHLVNGAARRVLGQHIWQFGTQKGEDRSRLDISHYQRIGLPEIHKIEELANRAILQDMPVETSWLSRSEAESLYGFRLYQGGAVPGKEIRVVKTGDWEVEACAGTHLKSTGEIGFMKITHSERVQDGVERLIYSVGIPALKSVQESETQLRRLSEILSAPIQRLEKTAERIIKDLKETSAEKRRLIKELAERESTTAEEGEKSKSTMEVRGIRIVLRDFKDVIDVERMVQTANEMIKRDNAVVAIFYGADRKNAHLMIMAGETALEKGVRADSTVAKVSGIIGGGGGGKANFAQGGGTKIDGLSQAVEAAIEEVKRQVESSPQ